MSKIALVTGGGRGIGKGIALALAQNGYDVGINYNSSKEEAEEVVDTIKRMGRNAYAFKANIQKVEEIEIMFKQFFEVFDHIDLMVNNAGITKMKPFLETDEVLFDDVINTDLKGTFFCAQMAAKNMVQKGIKGVIINISSNHSQGCWPNSTVYAAAKAGVDKLTKNMALELSEYGIRVITIAPGYTQVRWFDDERARAYIQRITSRIPLKRFATPEDIGNAVVFLASEKAGYITGTTLYIDGGALLPVLAENKFI